MIKYTVQQSFWATPGKVNWDTKEHGREGIGIPKALVKRGIKSKQLLKILIESSGRIYEVSPRLIKKHDDEWKTEKTAPKGTQNLFLIVPVSMLQFVGYTTAKWNEIEEAKKEAAEKKKLAEMQTALF